METIKILGNDAIDSGTIEVLMADNSYISPLTFTFCPDRTKATPKSFAVHKNEIRRLVSWLVENMP